MKRIIMIAVCALVLSASVFAQNLRNGTFFAQDADFTNNLRNQVIIVVTNGRISAATWNVLSLNAGAADQRTLASAQGAPAALTAWLNNARTTEAFLVETQNLNATTVPNVPTSGAQATNVAPFFTLARQAVAANNPAVERGTLPRDGWFFATDPTTDAWNYRNTILLTVVNGRIVDVLWNGVLQNPPRGMDPSRLILSRTNRHPPMRDDTVNPPRTSTTAWHAQSESMGRELVRVQNIDNIRINAQTQRIDGATGVSVRGDRFAATVRLALQTAR